MLCKRSTKTQRVSHLILDRKYLYSSHHNEGSIRKWDLAANARLAKATADHIPGDLNREALEKLSWRPYDKKILGILLTTVRCMYVSLSAKEQAWSCTPLLLQDSGRMPMLLLCMGSISSGFVAANKVLFLGINAMAATPPSLREDCDRGFE